MRAKIAPALTQLIDEPWTADVGGPSTSEARRELRALVALYRATQRIVPLYIWAEEVEKAAERVKRLQPPARKGRKAKR